MRAAFPDWLREFEDRMLDGNPWSILEGGDMHQVFQWIFLPLWISGSVQEAIARVSDPMTRMLAEWVEQERALKRDPVEQQRTLKPAARAQAQRAA